MVAITRRYVYFYIEGGEFHPDRISEITGVQPDKIRIKGASNPDRKFPMPYSQNSWHLVENGGPESDISELLDRLQQRVVAIKSAVKKLAEWRVGVMIVAHLTSSDPTGPGFDIDPNFVSLMNELDGRFTVDLYVLDQQGEE